jgi:hypothetical protein
MDSNERPKPVKFADGHGAIPGEFVGASLIENAYGTAAPAIRDQSKTVRKKSGAKAH